MSEDFEKELVIDDSQLDRELSMQAAQYVYIAERAIVAEREYDLFKQQLNKLRAEVEKAVRKKAAEDGRKITNAVVDAEIDTNHSVVKANIKLIDLKSKREVLKARKEAWWMRKDCLIQKAIAKRSEMESLRSTTVKASESAY